MSWRDDPIKRRIIKCPGGHERTFDADECALALQGFTLKDGSSAYGWGDHVSDPLAIIRRTLSFAGWIHLGGSPDEMVCPKHRPKDD